MTQILTEADISKLVHAFYARVRQDDILAPVFATKIGADDWPAHINHIADFWSSIFLKTGRFTGNPMQKHFALAGLTPAHFTRWLFLFRETADQVLVPAHAGAVHAMAERIAQSFQMGLAFNLDNRGAKNHPFKDFGLRPPHSEA